MNKSERAKEYATALFTLAMEQSAAKKFAAAEKTLKNIFAVVSTED